MADTVHGTRRPPFQNIKRRSVRQPAAPAQLASLRRELTRRRAQLLRSSFASLTIGEEPTLWPDLADQASADLEQDLAIQAKVRTMTKLRSIERALLLMRTRTYGQCRRCHEQIPYSRLRIQPDALFCVPCLTAVEGETPRH